MQATMGRKVATRLLQDVCSVAIESCGQGVEHANSSSVSILKSTPVFVQKRKRKFQPIWMKPLRLHVVHVCEKYCNNITKAANALGVSRNTVRKYLE